uniref:Gamma-tubulin complex component n=1 Tax=Wuchereria bancrofti TaxID=6293 RepID=A0AAF5PST8_WUCBA
MDEVVWKKCRKQIILKLLPFTSFSLPGEYCSSQPDASFTPMEHINLSSLTLQSQEQHLVKDLFLVYMAYQGNSIRFIKEGDSVTWTVNPSSDTCLRSALYTDACLPLAATLIQLRHNIKNICCELSRGRVALAVGSAAEEFFNLEVMPLLVKLELENRSDQRSLTLAEVATYMRPYMQITKQLNDVLATMIKNDLVGGEVLSMLSEQIRKCVSPTTRDMLQKFEVAGLEQYFELLFWWIRYGKIQDYCHDFMIWDLKSSKMFTKSDIVPGDNSNKLNNFDDQFCVVEALCPSQLQPAFEDVVNCGIYLNIAEMIKGETTTFDDERIGEEEELEEWKRKSVDDVVRDVKKARLKASKDLVQILRKQFGLDEYFESFHNFLLLQRSDWLVSFYELSRDMLIGSIRDISIKKLQILFEEAVDCSTLHFDKHRHRFRPVLEKYDMFTSLHLVIKDMNQDNKLNTDFDFEPTESKNGLDALSVHINVDSPLSLVFPPQILLYYNLFFRIFFYLFGATAQILNKQMRSDLVTLNDRRLLQEMLHFLNAYSLHCWIYVVPRSWSVFIDKLSKSASLEEILLFQRSFFVDATTQCFLPGSEFMSLLSNLVSIIYGFTTDEIKYDESAEKWNDCLGKMCFFLSQQNNNNAYAQLHSRIFSQFY